MTSSSMRDLEKSQFITINGVKMTIKEYKKIKAAKNSLKSKKHKKEVSEIMELGLEIKKIVRHAAPIKSLAAYYDNGYRQWGKIVEDFVFNNHYIKKPYSCFRISARELYEIINDIEKLSSKNDNYVFSYIDKLRYKMMDIDEELVRLNKAITQSEICDIFANEKFINEKGRRLGLKTLLINANLSVYKIKEAIKKIEELSREAESNIEYDPYTLKRFR